MEALTELLDKLPIGVAIFDPDDRMLYWNPVYLEMFPEEADILAVGLSYHATLRRFFQANLSPGELNHLDRHLTAGLARHRSLQTFQYQRRDGRWYEVSGHRLSDGRLLKVWVDVTRSRIHGAAKSRLDDALAAIDVGIAIYDPRGQYLLSNKALDEILPTSVGMHRPGVGYGQHLAEYIENELAPEEARRLAHLVGRGLPNEKTRERGMTVRTRDRHFLTFDEHVGVGGELFVVWQDVTENQRNQSLLRDGMSLLEQIAKDADLASVLTLVAAMVEDHGRSIDCIAVLFEGDQVFVHESDEHDLASLRSATDHALRLWREPTTQLRRPPACHSVGEIELFVDRFKVEANRFGLEILTHRPLGPGGEPPAGVLLGIGRTPGATLDPNDEAVLERAVQLANLAIGHDRRARAVQAAREAAEIANRAKSDFLAKMSHELRTPLNAIIGFAEMMSKGIGGSLTERHRDYTSIIQHSGQHLLTIINDILDISRIESGEVILNEEPVSIAELWHDSAEIVGSRARSRRIAFRDDDFADITLVCDPTKIRQCILNLLSNAVKYSEDGTFVEVTLTSGQNGAVEFAVIDRGCGMSDEQIARAMRPFAQVNPSRLTERAGVGLGLPITKALMELHDGRLTLNSAPGVGTKALLTFPAWRRVTERARRGRERA